MIEKIPRYFLFAPIIGVYLVGMFIDVMDVDASQYASMAREMEESGSYLKLYNRGEDYLDKPPLLFWASAISFKLFGISNFSYKLPSVLFTLLGLFSTYRLGRLLYNKNTGFYAALFLGSCQAWFLINHDVRTDTILAASTIFAVWQMVVFVRTGSFSHLILAAFGVAGAMLTKGPIGLMVPALALGTDFILKREWSNILKWQWLLMLAMVGILLSPFLYGLYHQYDLEPGKVINSMEISSGIKFFLWTQSFGRLTGENAWRDDSSALFFTHTFLWSFLPWALFFIAGFWSQIRRIITSGLKYTSENEAITIGGFLLPFVAFSLSNYKLPHYIYVVFPLAAITAGRYVDELDNKIHQGVSAWQKVHLGIGTGLLLVVAILISLSFPSSNLLLWGMILGGVLLSVYVFLKSDVAIEKLIIPSLVGIVVANFILNVYIYPYLLSYQSYKLVAWKAREEGMVDKLVTLNDNMHSLDFYSRKIIPNYSQLESVRQDYRGQKIWLLTTQNQYEQVLAQFPGSGIIEVYDHFHATQLTLMFLNPATRGQELQKKYLLYVPVKG